MHIGVPKGPKDQREHLGRLWTYWVSNPLPLGSGPATSPTGPGRTPMGLRPAAPTSGAPAGPRPPLCSGVRKPRPPHHHPPPLCYSAGAPWAPGETFPPLCGGVGPLGGPPPLCMVVSGRSPAFPHRFSPFPGPPAALAASPCLLELLEVDSPHLPASGRLSAPRTAAVDPVTTMLSLTKLARACSGTFL